MSLRRFVSPSFGCRRYCTVVYLTLLASLAGCDGGPETGVLDGTVTIDGKKLTHGSVVSSCENGGGNGAIRDDGTFQLSSNSHAGRVSTGTHRLAVIAYEGGKTVAGAEMTAPLLFSHEYANPRTSGFKAEVKANETTTIHLEINTSR